MFSRNIVSERLEVDVLGITTLRFVKLGVRALMARTVKPIVCHHLEVILLRNQWFVRMEGQPNRM